jgi:peptidoglycan/xylan/chitin deacetylase (PgdA/CDA1 family)
MYHAVTPVRGRLRHLGVTPELLRVHLMQLRREGFRLVGITEALRIAELDSTGDVVALTFDDAFTDFLDVVVPILKSVDARATLYVATAHVGSHARWLGAASTALPQILSWDQLREIVASGRVEVGSHSHSHLHLDTLPLQSVEREIRDSRRLLEEILRIDVKSFCYPHGYHSPTVRQAVQAAGYDNACEVGRRLRSDCHRWSLSRLAVGPKHGASRLVREVRHGGPLILPVGKRTLQPVWREIRRCRGVPYSDWAP